MGVALPDAPPKGVALPESPPKGVALPESPPRGVALPESPPKGVALPFDSNAPSGKFGAVILLRSKAASQGLPPSLRYSGSESSAGRAEEGAGGGDE